jgi:hypothetical protein
MTMTTTTLSTCGGTDLYCSVEYDSTGDGRPDCCTADNNPVCGGCLSHCIEQCGEEYVGVATCFMDEKAGPFCQCTEIMPSCYEPLKTTTTLPATRQPQKPGNIMMYLFVLGTVILALAASVHFVYKTK